MAIDKVHRFVLAVPQREEDNTLKALYASNIIHLATIDRETAKASIDVVQEAKRPEMDAALTRISEQIELVNETLSFFAEIDPITHGLVESFFSDEIYVTPEELHHTAAKASGHEYSDLMHRALAVREQLADQRARLGPLTERLSRLSPWIDLPVDTAKTEKWRWISMLYGIVPLTAKDHFMKRLSETQPGTSVETIFEDKIQSGVVVACPRERLDDVRILVVSEGLIEQDLATVRGTVASAVDTIEESQRSIRKNISELELEAASLVAHRRELTIYHEYLVNEQNRLRASDMLTRTQRCSVVTGYVRQADTSSLERLGSELKVASCVVDDAEQGDETPVSITNNKWLKPFEILINMFGFPLSSTFDPTPFLMIPFLAFFGLCLGDAVYGALQIGLCYYFMRKHRRSSGVRNFMMVFVYGGIASIIVGALTGSWAGDLLSEAYLGIGNPVSRFVDSLTMINPLQAAFQFLVIVWIIGGVNQLYGVCLAIHKAARRHDYATIMYDCVGWLLLLPGLTAMLFIGTKFGPGFRTGYLVAMGIGLVLLLAGGARTGKGAGKIAGALVNLYGIQSSYGVGSFLGDVLSYSRLLALGLTTSILGSSFNMIAALIKAPAAGVVVNLIVRIALGGLVMLFGHLLNYFMGTMGAFIHSARLILLEFFGRFYEGGAPRFRRFGFTSEVVKLVDDSSMSSTGR